MKEKIIWFEVPATETIGVSYLELNNYLFDKSKNIWLKRVVIPILSDDADIWAIITKIRPIIPIRDGKDAALLIEGYKAKQDELINIK